MSWPLVAAPDRQRRAPVPLARERPVDVVLEPVAVAAVPDVLGVPVDAVVHLEQAVLAPRWSGRTRRCARSRGAASRSASRTDTRARRSRRVEQQAARRAGPRRSPGRRPSRTSPRTNAGASLGEPCRRRRPGLQTGQPLRAADREVVGRRTRARGGRCRCRRPARRSRPATTVCAPSTFGYGGSYRAPTSVGAVDDRRDRRSSPRRARLGAAAPRRSAARRRARRPRTRPSAATAAPVFDGSVHGRRRPDEERGADERRSARLDDREAGRRRSGPRRSVPLRDLGVGQRGAAPRAVRRDLVVLDEQAALVQPLQRPPDALDVRRSTSSSTRRTCRSRSRCAR